MGFDMRIFMDSLIRLGLLKNHEAASMLEHNDYLPLHNVVSDLLEQNEDLRDTIRSFEANYDIHTMILCGRSGEEIKESKRLREYIKGM